MEIVSEGSLASISRPASSSKRSSSRSSVRSASHLQGSLDVLPCEDPSDWARPELEEDIVVIEFNDDDSDSEDDQSSDSPGRASSQLNPNHPDDSEGISSAQVEVTEPNQEAESETGSVSDNLDSDDLDPKIRKGLEKIKRLDNILSEKIKNEKEVKRQRRMLERTWREQIENLERTRDAELGKQVDLGPAHLLALGAPEDKDDDNSYEESPPVTPLFATQPIVDEERLERRHLQGKLNLDEEGQKDSYDKTGHAADLAGGMNESNQDGEKVGRSKDNNKRDKKEKKTRKKDFIKRNIMLAADANNVIAMTEEEKKRLEELLCDINNLVDEQCDKRTGSLTLYGNGFQPSQEEVNQLADIDFQLQALLPSEEFDVLCNQNTSEQDMFSQVCSPRSEGSSKIPDEETHTFGELVLQEKKEMREMKQRLLAIENQLSKFKTLDDSEAVFSESLLRQLLDGNSRTTSEATTIFDRISSLSTSMSCDTSSSLDSSLYSIESPSLVTRSQQQ